MQSLQIIIYQTVMTSVISLCLAITMLVFMCTDSTPEENEYGKSPKYDPEYEDNY